MTSPLIINNAATLELALFQAMDALDLDHDDWSSDRQVRAENLFFETAEALLPQPTWRSVRLYSIKATLDERVDFALSAVLKSIA